MSLLGPLDDQAQSLHSLLLALETQARVLLEKIGKAAANGSVPKSGKSSEKVSDKTSDDKLARDFLAVSKEVTMALKNTGFLPDINGESSGSGTCSAPEDGGSGSPNDCNMSNHDEDGSPLSESSPDSPQPGPSGLNFQKK